MGAISIGKEMHRFFIPPEWIDQEMVVIRGKLVHQIRNVLRLRGGDHIVLLDNTGWEYEAELAMVTRDQVKGVIFEKRPAAEPGVRITLYQALPKRSKFEFILQKCTELGVSGFVPVICERCVADRPRDKRVERWHSIIVESAEQSLRKPVSRQLVFLCWPGRGRRHQGCALYYEAKFTERELFRKRIICPSTYSSALREAFLLPR
jgi:16S rRNA (uracil1498-N3)-methyltransferase